MKSQNQLSDPVNGIRRILKLQGNRYLWGKYLFLICSLTFIVSFTVYSLIQYSGKNLRLNLFTSMQQDLEQRKNNLELRFTTLYRGTESLISLVYPYMNLEAGRAEQLEEYQQLNSFIRTYLDNGIVTNIRLYVPEGKLYGAQGHTFRSLEELQNSPDGKSAKYLQNSGLFWQETTDVDNVGLARDTIQAISCVYSIRQRTDYDSIACVLFLDMDVSLLDAILTPDTEPEKNVYLINQSGVCLAAPDRQLIGRPVIADTAMTSISQKERGSFVQDDMIYVFEKLDTTQWYIVMALPEHSVNTASIWSGGFVPVILSGILLIFAFTCFNLAHSLVMNATLHQIDISLAQSASEKDRDGSGWNGTLRAASRLEKNVNTMVLTIKDLMEDRYKDQLAITQYQMKALQEQIKPHFLYNTLDMIKWMIAENKTEDGVWMVNTLSRYLRQSISKGSSIIPLSEELELSKTYLAIMMKRFEHRFVTRFETEDGVEECLIPKFSLQPLLENALLHGILYCEKADRELWIRAWKDDNLVIIEIEDNGNGMSEEKVKALEEDSGYGLSNVRKRLLIFGKEEADFHISSREGMGTCVTISIPAVYEKEGLAKRQ